MTVRVSHLSLTCLCGQTYTTASHTLLLHTCVRNCFMTGPDGSMTNRDSRRNARRSQFEMRQAERHRERERKIRQQRLQRFAIVGGGILVFLLISFFVIHAVIGSGGTSKPPHHSSRTIPAGVASSHMLEYLGLVEQVVAPPPL